MGRGSGRPTATEGQRLTGLVGGHPAATYRAVARRPQLDLTPALAKKWRRSGEEGKAPNNSSGVHEHLQPPQSCRPIGLRRT